MSELKAEYTTGEVARMLGVTAQTVRRWVASGALRAHRFGTWWRVPLSALLANADRWESVRMRDRLAKTQRDATQRNNNTPNRVGPRGSAR